MSWEVSEDRNAWAASNCDAVELMFCNFACISLICICLSFLWQDSAHVIIQLLQLRSCLTIPPLNEPSAMLTKLETHLMKK